MSSPEPPEGQGSPPSVDWKPGPRIEIPGWQLAVVRAWFRTVGSVAPHLASRMALRAFLKPHSHGRPAREDEWVLSSKRTGITGPAGRLAGLTWGDGAPVLLSHGWEGRASQMGAFAIALAQAGRRAVAYDAPGHGATGGRTSSLVRFGETARAGVEVDRPLAGFVGHSFGVAGLCLALWQRWIRPEDVGRLVFVAPPADLHRFIVFFERLLGISETVAHGYEDGLERLLGLPWSEARTCTVRAACERPLLIVADEEDLETPITEAEALVEAWPEARLVRTSGLGHRRILRDPEVVAQVVSFLTEEP
jgi:pimeloyl-ACP methyl ester carboxylesterase